MIESIYAAYNDEGEIVGLYSTAIHKKENIPQQSIVINNTQRLQIAARTKDFKVVDGRLHDTAESVGSENVLAAAIVAPVKPKWTSGFMYKDVCYAADDVSSSHVTQCLVLAGLDNKHKFSVKTYNKKGEVEWKEVVFDDLKVIVAGINKLRSE